VKWYAKGMSAISAASVLLLPLLLLLLLLHALTWPILSSSNGSILPDVVWARP